MLEHQIQKYTREWSNFLPSDPGMTILEYLELFHKLQLGDAAAVTEEAKVKLLEMLGFTPQAGRPSSVLVQSVSEETMEERRKKLWKYGKFYAGGKCFESMEDTVYYPGALTEVYAGRDGSVWEIPELSRGNPLPVYPFGQEPKPGDSLYLLFSGPPVSRKENCCRLFVKEGSLGNEKARNPWSRETGPVFAEASWSYLTQNGYLPLECIDDTGVFLCEGEITLKFGTEQACIGEINGRSGYLIRCTLTKADYDLPPCIREIAGPLHRLVQRDTKAALFSFPLGNRIRIHQMFQEEEQYVFVYGRAADGDGFVEYRASSGGKPQAPCYRKRTRPDQTLEFKLDTLEGAVPEVCIVCCSREVMVHRKLGSIQGFEGEAFGLPAFPGILRNELRLDAVREGKDGHMRHFFFVPGDQREDALFYEYDEKNREIRILDAGAYEGAMLYLCGCAVHEGDGGNVLEGLSFVPAGQQESGGMYNPTPGTGGCREEDIGKLQARLMEDLRSPVTGVTLRDYEELAQQTPGLCIHKVKARSRGRDIFLTVKPNGTTQRPQLTENYRRQILNYLDRHRLLGIKLHVQGPVYIPIRVYADVVVDSNFPQWREQVEAVFHHELDDTHNQRHIGEPIPYASILRKLEGLTCVLRVQEFKLSTEGRKMEGPGAEIPIDSSGLCYVEEIVLDVSRRAES